MFRVVSYLGCAAVAASLGAVAGYHVGQGGTSDEARAIDLFATAQSRFTAYQFAIRKDGHRSADESALRAYLEYLDARSRDAKAPSGNVYAFDKAIVLIRLSDYARSRRATDEADRLAKQADALCPSIGLGNCSANMLLATVRGRDRRVWSSSAKSGP